MSLFSKSPDPSFGDTAPPGRAEALPTAERSFVSDRPLAGPYPEGLGQAVFGADGWTVLDFEGEPGRPIREWRRKRSPLRDVAGMLRSFSYAASAVELLRDGRARDGWEQEARTRFLAGYMAEIDPAILWNQARFDHAGDEVDGQVIGHVTR